VGGSKEGTDKAALLGYIFGGAPYDGGVYTQQFYAGGSSNYGAFHNCAMLTDIRLPDKTTSIGQRTFENCTSLHTVTFTGNAPSISGNSFNAVTAADADPGAVDRYWVADCPGYCELHFGRGVI